MGLLEKVAKIAITAAVAKGAATVVSMIDEDAKRSEGKSPYNNDYEIIGSSANAKDIEKFQFKQVNKTVRVTNIKCPFCGAPVQSNLSNCPYCDSALPEEENAYSIDDLIGRLAEIDCQRLVFKTGNKSALADAMGEFTGRNEREEKEKEKIRREFDASKTEQKKVLIQSFPVPNTRKGMTDFMDFLVRKIQTDNIEDKMMNELWIEKMEQVYRKACISLQGTIEFDNIKDSFNKKKNEIEWAKERRRMAQEKAEADSRKNLLLLIAIFVVLLILLQIIS